MANITRRSETLRAPPPYRTLTSQKEGYQTRKDPKEKKGTWRNPIPQQSRETAARPGRRVTTSTQQRRRTGTAGRTLERTVKPEKSEATITKPGSTMRETNQA